MSKKRVAIALSGGVDSSIAACLLRETGHEVIGLTMSLFSEDRQTCPTAESIYDAENVCRTLDIPFHLMDMEQEFKEWVVDYFCREYAAGRTPNPCIACNRHIKFGRLLDSAFSLGADFLATGHYVRVKHDKDGYHLLKGCDSDKDQSYMLYTLSQEKLSRVMFPLGEYSKTQVRELAAEKGLPIADKPSSQDICFIAGDYGTFLSRYLKTAPGDIVDNRGSVMGRHKGTAFYTVGQRHGLGLAAAEPVYVTQIDPAKSRLTVGSRAELYRSRLTATEVSWISGKRPAKSIKVTVKIRYRAPEVAATLQPAEGSAEVTFEQPQPAITPGQAVVFYLNDEVLGGGTIES
jgi:tRNA-uridine 2-sulfurtransferase